MTTGAAAPDLSVVLVVGALRSRAADCLRSLLDQSAVERLEVLLVDLAPTGAPAVAGSGHSSVRRIPLPPETTYAAARAHGVREAKAPIVAFLEEHCRARGGWAEAIRNAFDGPWAGVGGEVHNGNPQAPMSPTIALMNYSTWLPPARRDEDAAHLPGHNSAFRRATLLALGDELEPLLVSDINLHRRLREQGERLLLDPAVQFEHVNETGILSLVRGYVLWHRLYGASRARAFRWGVGKRWLYVVLAPAIPLYFLARVHRQLRRERPELLPAFVRGIPLMAFAQLASAFGQAVGLVAGPGDAARRFTKFELEEPRPAGRAGAPSR